MAGAAPPSCGEKFAAKISAPLACSAASDMVDGSLARLRPVASTADCSLVRSALARE